MNRNPKRYAWIWAAGLAVVLAASLLVQTQDMSRPMRTYRDANGFSQGRIAHNYEKYGLWDYKLLPIFDKSTNPDLNPVFKIKYASNPFFLIHDDRLIMAHYPPTLSLTLHTAYQIFGYRPWTTRLVPIIATVITLLLFFALVHRLAGGMTALLATGLLALCPIVLTYGQMPDTMIFTTVFFMLAMYFYMKWDETRSPGALAVVLLATAAGCSFGWFAYFTVPLFVAHHIFGRRGKFSWLFFFALPAVAGLCLTGFVTYLYYTLGRQGLMDWLSAYTHRKGQFVIIKDTYYPITTFQFLKTMTLRVPFHYTWAMTLTVPAWLWGMRKRVWLRPDKPTAGVLFMLGVYGLLPIVIFKQGAYVHGFYMYMLGPSLCLAGALALGHCLRASLPWKLIGAACLVVFLYVTYPRSQIIGNYLSIARAEQFGDFVLGEADEKTVVGQNIYDLGVILWITTYKDMNLLAQEIPHEDIVRIVNLLPPGYKFKYVYLPLPDDMRPLESEKTVAWLFRKFGWYKKGGYIIFDSTLPPVPLDKTALEPVPAFGDHGRVLGRSEPLNLDFQRKLRLIQFGVDAKSKKIATPGNKRLPPVQAGDSLRLTYEWECLDDMSEDYYIYVRIVPGILHHDHEPVSGLYLTRYWRPGDVVTETYNLRVPPDTPEGDYSVGLAVCASVNNAPKCLRPVTQASGSAPTFTEIARLTVTPNPDVPPTKPDRVLVSKLNDMKMYLEYQRLMHYKRYIKYIGVDPVISGAFKGWEYLFLDRRDQALPYMENLSRHYTRFGLIEKMIPTAMQEVPVMLKSELINIYMEKHRFFAAGREAISLLMNLPQSPQIFFLIGTQLQTRAPDSNAPEVLRALSDYFFKRMTVMRPHDAEARKVLVEHYLKTGRPHKAFEITRAYPGVIDDNAVDMHLIMASDALARGRLDDFSLARRRLLTLRPGLDFDARMFELLLFGREHDIMLLFLSRMDDGSDKARYWLRALREYYNDNDLQHLVQLIEVLDAEQVGVDKEQKRTLSAYYETLGIEAYKNQGVLSAVELYEKAHLLAPDHTGPMMNLAVIYREMGKPSKARAMLKKLLAIDPDDKEARHMLQSMTRDRGGRP